MALLSQLGPRVESRHEHRGRRALLLVALLGPIANLFAGEPSFSRVTAQLVTSDGRFPLSLEVARTDEERAYGLMHRRELATDSGMLFDFGGTQRVAMWMKDTLLSLDMVFFDAELRVVWIHKGAKPLSLEIIAPPMPVAYVLELPAGSVKRFGISAGSRLELASR